MVGKWAFYKDYATVTMNDIVERLEACTWWEGKKRNLDQLV